MRIKLNEAEKRQYGELLECIRADIPNNPQPARHYIDLCRGRVCVYLNQQINTGGIKDIKVDRSGNVDRYYHG